MVPESGIEPPACALRIMWDDVLAMITGTNYKWVCAWVLLDIIQEIHGYLHKVSIRIKTALFDQFHQNIIRPTWWC